MRVGLFLHFFCGRKENMEKVAFEDLHKAFKLCLKNKKNKNSTYDFYNNDLYKNLYMLLVEINDRTYQPMPSDCYGVTYPTPREIYAAKFKDRIIQHFYMMYVEELLEKELIRNCCSCRKDKGVDYALKQLKDMVIKVSQNGTSDCYFLKIDLSGFFMNIERETLSKAFYDLINEKYIGKYKEVLLWLTPIIFLKNPAKDCIKHLEEKFYKLIPERRVLKPDSELGLAIGNLTSQGGANMYLNEFDHYVTENLGFENYIRYVDDIIVISDDKTKLINSLAIIKEKLEEKGQHTNDKKTKISTAYYGVPFLGKVTFPYGYQKATKEVCKRTINHAKELKSDDEYLLEKTNSHVGTLKNFNCNKLIRQYNDELDDEIKEFVTFNKETNKYVLVEKCV